MAGMTGARLAGWLGTALLVAFFARWWAREGLDELGRWVGFASSALLIAFVAFDREQERPAARSPRQLQVALAALTLATAVASAEAARRVDRVFTLRADATEVLAPHTVATLKDLSFDVEVIAFFSGHSAEQRRFRGLLDRARAHTDRLAVTWVDPLREPALAETYGVEADHERGQVILRARGEEQRIGLAFDQVAFTRALDRLMHPQERRICWSEGHGEADPDDDRDPREFGLAVLSLESESYTVAPVSLLAGDVPRACDALVIARPLLDFGAPELDALRRWTASGGGVALLLDRGAAPRLVAFLAELGLEVRDADIQEVDPAHRLATSDGSVLVSLPGERRDHPVTDGLPGAVVLGSARSVRAAAREVADTVELVATSATALEGGGNTGPIPVASVATVTAPDRVAGATDVGGSGAFAVRPGARWLVIGDADFASNQMVSLGNNLDLFLNGVAWVTGDDGQGARPVRGAERVIVRRTELGALFLLLVVGIPGGALALATLRRPTRRRRRDRVG